jgi:formamidopyrimidine-DNA glycosylase
MVEGPQATAQANWVRKTFNNKTLQKVQIVKGRYKRKIPKNFIKFQNLLPLKLKEVIKKGKVLFLFFENDWVLIIKFGMTAWLSDQEDDPNIVFDFGSKKLYYKDLRQFGTITFTNDPIIILKELNKIAPDVLDDSIEFKDIQDRIKNNKSIDQILMDQKLVVSGIGNIIKSEVLYDAKINPKRKGIDLSEQEWKKVFNSARNISKRILRNIESNKDDFSGIIQVYENDKDKLGNQIENYISKDGRRTYWVPKLQK